MTPLPSALEPVIDVRPDAGEPLLGPAGTAPTAAQEAGAAIERYIAQQGLPARDLRVHVAGGIATVTGTAPDQATRERIVLCCGNVRGVARVRDRMHVVLPARPSRYYTVRGGDTLTDIARHHYRNPCDSGRIFEANRPMLRDPSRIYPGQLLRIPP